MAVGNVRTAFEWMVTLLIALFIAKQGLDHREMERQAQLGYWRLKAQVERR